MGLTSANDPDSGGDLDLEAKQVDRVVAAYLVAAALWIALSGPAAAWAARTLGVGQTSVEIIKGLAFVLGTAWALRSSLRRWALRVSATAWREREAADRLRQAEQLRSALLNGVSHELRTPLTSVIGYGHTVKRLCHARQFDQVEPLIDRLMVHADRLEALVVDLTDTDAMSRGMGQPQTQRVDIGELVRRVVDRIDTGTHQVELSGQPMTADVDVPKFERIIGMLVDNAVRHTPESTRVTVGWARQGPELVISIDDDGPGFPADPERRLFEPFVQGDDAAQGAKPGMGLGLTLVEHYVRLHTGRVTATSRPGGGTSMEVRIPLVHISA